MLYVLLTIIIIGIILFASTFFMNDKLVHIEQQLEQFSISTMQDTYQLNKKLKVLEEELLTNNSYNVHSEKDPTSNTKDEQPLLLQKVYHLYEQGYSIEDISKETGLKNYDIQTILNHQTD